MKIGVIGLGSIGLRHAKNLLAMGHEVWGDDLDDGKRNEFKIAGGRLPQEENFMVDAMVIATPTEQHIRNIYTCASFNVPIFVEKPIGHKRFGRVPHVKMVGNNLRFHSCVKRVREWMGNGLIGLPTDANFLCLQYNNKPAYLRDGVILNWGAHEVDLALYLLGPAKVVASSGNDTKAVFQLEHKNGCVTNIWLDYTTTPQVRKFSLISDTGVIHANLEDREAVGVNYPDGMDGGTQIETHIGNDSFDANYLEEMRAFVDRINGKETLGATGEEGLATLEILLKAREMAGLT